MKAVPYILYLLLIAFYLTILSDLISIFGIRFDLVAMLVVLVGLFKNETVALWFALSVALVAGTQRLDIMPWEMLVLGGGALIVNQVSLRVNLESVMSRLIVVGVFVFFHQIIQSLFISYESIFYSLYKIILPSVLYALVVAWLFFRIKDGNITWLKIKSLF